MYDNKLENETIEAETGTEVDDSTQNIPGTAPSFDTITEQDLNNNNQPSKEKEDYDDEETYHATSINNKNNVEYKS